MIISTVCAFCSVFVKKDCNHSGRAHLMMSLRQTAREAGTNCLLTKANVRSIMARPTSRKLKRYAGNGGRHPQELPRARDRERCPTTETRSSWRRDRRRPIALPRAGTRPARLRHCLPQQPAPCPIWPMAQPPRQQANPPACPYGARSETRKDSRNDLSRTKKAR